MPKTQEESLCEKTRYEYGPSLVWGHFVLKDMSQKLILSFETTAVSQDGPQDERKVDPAIVQK